MLGAIARNYGHLLRRRVKDDLLLSQSQFEREIARERIRASRRSIPFCLITIEQGRADNAFRNEQVLIRLLHRHLRMTDLKGWLDQRKLGVLLVDTPEMGGRSVLDRLTDLTEKHGIKVKMHLRVHDPAGFDPDEHPEDHSGQGGNRSADDRRLADQPASRWVRLNEAEVEVSSANPLVQSATSRRMVKRGLDIFGASVGLVLGSPVILGSMALIKVSSSGPAIFKQTREGQHGRPFTIYKMRTMVVDAEKTQDRLRCESHRDGPAFKITNDPRVTSVGRILRKTCIDELPQLWNVLKGEMSLVGPRPLPWHESRACDPWHRRRLDVRPGMTCEWQVNKAAAKSFDDWMRMDLRYIDQINIVRDLRLIAQTFIVPLRGKGAE